MAAGKPTDRISRLKDAADVRAALARRWQRDPHVLEMIAELDRPERINRPELLTRSEKEAIANEISRCRESFEYAARNYFWIVYENGMDGPFVLWESQELILERIREIKEKGRPQKVQIIKARRLGCSTLIEAMIAHHCFFFSNKYGLIVSYNQPHSEYLFSIVLHIYDMLPWWLKPECASRKYEKGMHLESRDPEERRVRPGLNSRVVAEYATKLSGVGQGVRITGAHICLASDALIRTARGELVKISQVSPGDWVLTSSGLLRRIKRKVKSARRGPTAIRLSVWGSPWYVSSTLDHKFLTPDGFRQAQSISPGDRIVYPIRPIDDSLQKIVPSAIRPEEAFLVGFVAASDTISRSRSGSVSSLHWMRSEQVANEAAALVAEKAKAAGVEVSVSIDRAMTVAPRVGEEEEADEEALAIEKNAFHLFLSLSSPRLMMILDLLAPKGNLSDEIFSIGREQAKALLDGLIAGSRVEVDRAGIPWFSSDNMERAVMARELIASVEGYWPKFVFARRKYIKYHRARWDLSLSPIGKDTMWSIIQDGRFVEVAVMRTSYDMVGEFWDIEIDAKEHDFVTVIGVAHNSEYADYSQDQARAIIEGDMVYALANHPDTFAILESTAKGSGTYAHKLWRANVEMGEKAEWIPVFLPWFFERTRVMAPERGWRPEKPEIALRERVKRDWTRCTNQECLQYFESVRNGRSIVGITCPRCSAGTLQPLVLTDEQLCFIWHQRINKSQRGEDALKELRQELASTPEEAFQLSGTQVFPAECFEAVAATIDNNPIARGNLDADGHIHWVADHATGRCGQSWCKEDHRYDISFPLKIWEWPQRGAEYSLGADPAEGLGGTHDYSVAWVNRIGKGANPDVHVATYRSNTISPFEFATVVNALGRLYNNALVTVEYNTVTTVGDNLKNFYQYPNLYRWKHHDNVGRPESNKFHWVTNQKTRPALWQTAVKYLKGGLWVVRDQTFYSEMETFQKEEDSTRVEAGRGFHDDTLFAAMIALYASRETDVHAGFGRIQQPASISGGLIESPQWVLTCSACGFSWESATFNPVSHAIIKCPRCSRVQVRAKRKISEAMVSHSIEWDFQGQSEERGRSYEEL